MLAHHHVDQCIIAVDRPIQIPPTTTHSDDTLLLQPLGWHELHLASGRGLAECCPISGIVLLAFLHERPDRLRHDQLHLVSKTAQRAGPVMRRAAGFQHDGATLLLLEKRDQLAPAQLAPDLIHGVNLKSGLGSIKAEEAAALIAEVIGEAYRVDQDSLPPIVVMVTAGGSPLYRS
jgi:hypothetical protein